ncbi:DUF4157 domain-containing protein [uncultured Roseobacter sp.]|uniref:eCIS core domain-containing protein n=1 Tax=uncultured Roseobacter sp. TaxID=114847 RepID=UPI002615A6C1|nr:DUF4157 domain-containing protein [uncultured Roseobacter sp.]
MAQISASDRKSVPVQTPVRSAASSQHSSDMSAVARQDSSLTGLQRRADDSAVVAQLARWGQGAAQLKPADEEGRAKGGLPGALRSGVERLSGMDMSGVQVHYNSSEPQKVGAHAYAQGTDIHLASGQEKHLPHEAWHTVQQAQGRVRPTRQLKGDVQINDDAGLEKEADMMGAKAMSLGAGGVAQGKSIRGHLLSTATDTTTPER